MNTKLFQLLIPSCLLTVAIAWVTFGHQILNDGYGLKRDGAIVVPTVESTVASVSSLEDLMGYTTYLTFGFSYCSDNCPFTLSQYSRLAELLPDDTRLIFVSIDNTRDDLTHLNQYLTQINPRIIGWKLNEQDLNAFASQFKTSISISNNNEPIHDSAIQVINKEGHWVKTYPYLNLNKAAVLADYQAIQDRT